ncbi:hypothetical protein LSAT2_010177 [Lamellibrachia satsuma]|nr:hypothetical protein LSAT2_010177 [Lamellibrachia satsuma]
MEDNTNWTLTAHSNNGDLESAGADSATGINLSRGIYMYATPIFLTTGIGVNCLTIVLVSRMGVSKTLTNVFMFLTAIFNICAMLSGLFIVYLSWVWNIDFRTYGPNTCKCLMLLRDVTLEISIWYVVGFTVYRYVVVCKPMRRMDLSEPRTAAVFCSATMVLVIARNMYLLWTVGTHHGRCGVLPRYKSFHRNVRPWIDVVLDVVVPVVVVSACNVLTIRSLAAHRVSSRQMQASQETPTHKPVVYLVVAVVFYSCLMPVVVLLLLAPKWAAPGHVKPLQSVKNHLIYLHHFVYFFLYCFTGGAVRRELRSFYQETQQTLFDLTKLCRLWGQKPGQAETVSQRVAIDVANRPRYDQETIL